MAYKSRTGFEAMAEERLNGAEFKGFKSRTTPLNCSRPATFTNRVIPFYNSPASIL